MSQLKVTIWDTTVGYLAWDNLRNRAILEWDEAYIKAPFNLSPMTMSKTARLHYGGSPDNWFTGLPPLLADSLPDHFGNRIFQEWLIHNSLEENDLNPLERLLYIGKRGMGALEYEPQKQLPGNIGRIDFDELATISKQVLANKYIFKDHGKYALTHILHIGTSVGGAQPKILAAVHRKTKEIRAGDLLLNDPEFNYYIVKLAYNSGTSWGTEKTIVEYIYHRMAIRAGIYMMPCTLVKNGKFLHFQALRFDRKDGQKIHMQTFLALSGYENKMKPYSYEQAFIILEYLEADHQDKEELFRRAVFNVASCNMDDHLKNFACLMDQRGKWSLSPAYDLTYPYDPYIPSIKFHKLTINGKNRDITRTDLLVLAKHVGIRNPQQIIDQVIQAVSGFKLSARHYDLHKKTVEVIAADLKASIERLKMSK